MSKQKELLGKGIRALLSDIDSNPQEEKSIVGTPQEQAGKVINIPLEAIEVNPFQPRATFDGDALNDLSESIKIHGVIQPITVRKIHPQKYQLIAGERRLRASKLANKKTVPAYVRSANDQESLEIALIENIQREDLNAIEIGLNYQRLLDECDLNHERLGVRVGKKRSTITNYLRLLKLPDQIQSGLRNQHISMGHARTLVALKDRAVQLKIYQEIIAKGLSVRKVEELTHKLHKKDNPKEVKPTLSKHQVGILKTLSKQLNTKVELKNIRKDKGQIVINYTSENDLNRIIDTILS